MTVGNEEYLDVEGKKYRRSKQIGDRVTRHKNDDESRLDDCKKLQRTSPEVSSGASNAPYLST